MFGLLFSSTKTTSAPAFAIGLAAPDRFVEAQARRRVGARDDDEIGIAARGERRFDLADVLVHFDDRPRARKMPAALGRDLVFEMDRRNARRFELRDRAAHVHRVAVAGVGVADERNVDARRDAMRMARDQREIDEPDVGPAEQARRDAVARHVHRFETRLLDEARAVGIVNAGRDDHRAFGEALAQLLRVVAGHRPVSVTFAHLSHFLKPELLLHRFHLLHVLHELRAKASGPWKPSSCVTCLR